MTTQVPVKIELNQRLSSVAPSATLAITAKANELKASGVDVISLSAGEPDFDTPEYIKEAAVTALKQGKTKYTPVPGTVDIRKAVIQKLIKDQGIKFEPSQIIVTCGAKHAIFNTLFALLNEGDEVLIPSPYWLSYPEMVTVLGGKSVFVPTDESSDFKLTPEILKSKITAKSKVLILNSPSNPTGAVYTEKEMKAIAEVLKDFPRVTVISDEIYEKLIFDGGKHYSIASVDSDIAKRTVIINGWSKAYSMTGWRLGFVASPDKALAEAISSMQSHSTSNVTSFAQPGGVIALEKGDKDAADMLKIFEKRRNFFFEKIKAIPGIKPFKPGGAFYLFANIAATGMDSMTFSKALLEEAHVAVVPGKPFGTDKHIRMSFAISEEVLGKAADRIQAWLAKRK